jgi:hypothetical protein
MSGTVPTGVILDGQVPTNGGMRTGNLILNGDMELIEFVTPLWKPSLFTTGVESTSAGAWSTLSTSPYAGTYSLQAILTALKTGKPAYAYQEIPLNPGCQVDQLQLWHRCKFAQNLDADMATNANVVVQFSLVDSAGALVTFLTWTPGDYSTWTQVTREFRPSDYLTAVQMLAAVSLRVTLNVWPVSDVAGPVSYVARFDDFTMEAEAAFARNFSVGGTFPHRRDSAFERGTDRNRTLYQSSNGQGTAKRAGSIPFRLITEAQRDDLHGLWLYGARAPVTWYPVMSSYPDSVSVIFDPEWPFTSENADVGILHRGTLGWQEY